MGKCSYVVRLGEKKMPRVGLTREKVIERAAELANEKGIEAVTITTLAQYLEIKKPSLYNHIEGPEDLRRQIMLYGWKYISGCMVENIKEEDPNEELREVTEGLYQFFFEQTDKLGINRVMANHLLRTYRALLEGFLLLVVHDSFGNPVSIEESFEVTMDVFIRGIEQYEEQKMRTEKEITMNIPKIETTRLILRRHEEKGFADMLEYLSDEEVVAFEPYMPMGADEVRGCLKERMESEEFLAVEEKTSGKMIGNLYVGERFCDSVEIGYVFNRNYWHNKVLVDGMKGEIERL